MIEFEMFYSKNNKWAIGTKLTERDAKNIGINLMHILNRIKYMVLECEQAVKFEPKYNLIIIRIDNDKKELEEIKIQIENNLNSNCK